MNLNSDNSNELKIGTRVPVESKQGEFQYIDVGTSIWSRIEERSGAIDLSVRAEISNFANPEQTPGHDMLPLLRQLKISAGTSPCWASRCWSAVLTILIPRGSSSSR